MGKLYKQIVVLFAGVTLLQCFGVYAYDWVSNCSIDSDKVSKQVVFDDKGNTVPYCMSEEVDNSSNQLLVNVNTWSQKSDSLTDTINRYCSIVLSDNQLEGRIYFSSYIDTDSNTWDNRRTFDSQQSIFVYVLCSSFLSGESMPFVPAEFQSKNGTIVDGLTGDLAEVLKLQQIYDGENACELKNGVVSNNCDISLYATDIFSAIMSDLFKIKYAQLFHVDSVKDFDKKDERVKNLLIGYFKFGEDTFKSLKQRFPETISVINSNQQFYKNVLGSVKIIKNDDLAKLVKDDKNLCAINEKIVGKNYLACALHGGNGKNSGLDTTFLTLYYNEILNYRIFVAYYKHWLEEQQQTGDEQTKQKRAVQSADLQSLAEVQLIAANETLHELDEMVFTYPLHIGLLLYQEQIMGFRDKHLSPVITSFYSLSEKLKNVQTTD